MEDILYLGSSYSPRYIAESSYEDFISNKINNEKRIIEAVSETLIVNESYTSKERITKLTALYEANLGDKVKANWNRFIEFIKSIFSKFMESMTALLVDEKKYLEKYKDIIQKKHVKIEFSYTGDYAEGVKRINNTTLPVFNYGTHAADLRADQENEYHTIMKKLVPNMDYDDGMSLEDNCKAYFLDSNAGEKQLGGSYQQPNMTDLYNFCYNFSKIKAICDKDMAHLQSSTSTINSAINANLSEATMMLMEKEGDQNTTTGNGSDAAAKEKASNPNLKINTDPTSNASSYDDRSAVDNKTKDQNAQDAAADGNNTKNDIDNLTNKWMKVCRAIITAKWTAAEQIAKDYMAIIRAHVRSYVGKQDNIEDNQSTSKGTNYARNNNNEETNDNSNQQETNKK